MVQCGDRCRFEQAPAGCAYSVGTWRRSSRGDAHVVVGDMHRDVLGRISRMIERDLAMSSPDKAICCIEVAAAPFVVAGSGPQGMRTRSARRSQPHASRSSAWLKTGRRRTVYPHAIHPVKMSALEELDRLGRYTAEFSIFFREAPERAGSASGTKRRRGRSILRRVRRRLAQPHAGGGSAVDIEKPECRSSDAGGGLRFTPHSPTATCLRQVPANLCANSSQAVEGRGTVALHDRPREWLRPRRRER